MEESLFAPKPDASKIQYILQFLEMDGDEDGNGVLSAKETLTPT